MTQKQRNCIAIVEHTYLTFHESQERQSIWPHALNRVSWEDAPHLISFVMRYRLQLCGSTMIVIELISIPSTGVVLSRPNLLTPPHADRAGVLVPIRTLLRRLKEDGARDPPGSQLPRVLPPGAFYAGVSPAQVKRPDTAARRNVTEETSAAQKRTKSGIRCKTRVKQMRQGSAVYRSTDMTSPTEHSQT